jgi:hypothetical protein
VQVARGRARLLFVFQVRRRSGDRRLPRRHSREATLVLERRQGGLLAARSHGRGPCPLSPVYQAVRSVAAALKLSKPDGAAVFGLIYDANNPYFAGQGEWPGWPAVLRDALVDANQTRVRFRPDSWQALMPHLVLDDATRAWAHEKHGLT